MAIHEKVFSTIVSVFKKHGAVTIDTPKYGEDSKLIYDLNDQGGEKCSLRYDLTVPFARFLAMNGSQYQNLKRNQIAKVYRRDQPVMTKGRMREFYQCDFDIAGVYDPMIADSEVVKIMCECLTALDIGEYIVKINHRKILDGIFQICGVTDASIRPISSAVDKLYKVDVVMGGCNKELLDKLFLDQSLISNNNTKTGLNDMVLLFKYLEILISLARGLDYYTGIIYEAVTEQSGPPKSKDGNQIVRKTKIDSDELDETTVGVGSIAAGGRYDNLVGMFASNKRGNIPCVGISIVALEQVKANEVEVYAMAFADGLLEDRMKICSELWDAGIKAEFIFHQIPFVVIIGRDELNRGEIRIKYMRSKEQGEGGGASIKRSDVVNELKKRLGKE
ncbi:hypothetical protein C2G38_2133234 [Gigaspora rosea]|uniref:histidine--tRNA ligase n=1 Tax=Gigaspora rosea TaxID=44941 RepID=A0A397U5I5_9GLOM|nr:hypothetical protein C2G38_2133234 [Gigaspora rosea]